MNFIPNFEEILEPNYSSQNFSTKNSGKSLMLKFLQVIVNFKVNS